ncbi:LysM-like peptidoglycan-binding domain-containing protein [Photobacterium sp.]|uniref:LysM-like peptidoglycan-binding domain-containing protein n=1 Tax=Photobacterium sp. TaxID=660 RepID=UPI00299DD566|nr:LysM-like peptidoglycan-binding domain-containing protein [Photobacterium sp.]MDX1304471.1 LysM-like peptidoglycan-binding domain-containing protein [Photobacterium sp.]
MGQAKRRSKKNNGFKLPDFSFSQIRLTGSKQAWLEKLAPLKAKWQRLPKLHRRALAVLIPLVLVLVLLPASKKADSSIPEQTVRRDIELNIDNTPEPVDKRAEPVSPKRPSQLAAEVTEPAATTEVKAVVAEQWFKYQVQKGETLAHIFREKALPLSDLYAVAAIEGKGKPLSQIQSGQWLRYKQTANGQLDALQIESSDGDPVMFFRRSDGSFARGQ